MRVRERESTTARGVRDTRRRDGRSNPSIFTLLLLSRTYYDGEASVAQKPRDEERDFVVNIIVACRLLLVKLYAFAISVSNLDP